MSNLELYWMAAMIRKDEEEYFERRRDELEYLASFSNPKGVQQMRNTRDTDKALAANTDEEFAHVLQSVSGRALPQFQSK